MFNDVMMTAEYKDKKEIYLKSTIFYSSTVNTSCRSWESWNRNWIT